jgi:serine protease AprX
VSDYARMQIGLDSLEGNGNQLTGAGEVLGVVDSGIDADHPDFAGRVMEVAAVEGASPVDEVGHGTHVAGIAAGDGAVSGGKVRGMAPEAKLAVLGIVDSGGKLKLPPDVGDLLRTVADMGAKVINLSWGRALSSTYENGAMAVDTFIRERLDVLVVVAAGNEGAAPADYPSLYSIGTPATAKNGVTVGACCSIRPDFPDDTWGTYKPQKFVGVPTKDLPLCGADHGDRPAALSSRGPTDNESIGPDLLAPGTAILAPRARAAPEAAFWRQHTEYGGRYGFMNGTSMAAPVVSGAAVVVRQFLREQRSGADPSAALLKAVLIASAERLPWSRDAEDEGDFGYPDFDQGYGRLNVATALPTAGSRRRLEVVDIDNGSDQALESRAPPGAKHKAIRSYRFKVAEGAKEPLRVVVCWSDYAVGGTQNNLNLQLQCADATRIVGNPEHRWLVPKVKYLDPRLQGVVLDRRNNVQRIDVPDPQPGAYRARLLAENTLFPPQGYALCVSGELDGALEAEEQ